MQLQRLIFLTLAVLAASASACSSTPKAPKHPTSLVKAPAPRNAAVLLESVIDPKLRSEIDVDRCRKSPHAPTLLDLTSLHEPLASAGLDLYRDVELVVAIASGTAPQDRVGAVFQTRLSSESLRAAIDRLTQDSTPPGRWLKGHRSPAALVRLRGQDTILVLGQNKLLIALPGDSIRSIDLFAGPLFLPPIKGRFAAQIQIARPHEALTDPRAPRIPESLSNAVVELDLDPEGQAKVSLRAQSTSPEQAVADARALTERVEAATTVRVSILRIRVFRPIKFTAENRDVRSELLLKPREVQTLLGMARTALAGR